MLHQQVKIRRLTDNSALLFVGFSTSKYSPTFLKIAIKQVKIAKIIVISL